MRLASVIYLANQQTIGYPVEYVARSLLAFADELWLLAGDDWSYRWLLDRYAHGGGNQFVGRIEHPIATVGDIPAMMTRALSFVRGASSADFILLSQADEVATPEVAAAIGDWMTPAHRADARHCYCRIGFLYQHSATGWGNTICGRDFAGEFRGDGIGFDADGHHIDFLGDGLACYLEIGSLSPEMYFRHQSQHVKTWREYGLMGPRLAAYPGALERDPALAPWLKTPVSRDEFLRLSLLDARNRIFNGPLVPVESVDARFTKVIDDLGLRDDCTYVCETVRRLSLDR